MFFTSEHQRGQSVTMQGDLNEIDIRSILQLIELGQRTGELFVEAYSSDPRVGQPSDWLSSSLRPGMGPFNIAPRTPIFWFLFFVHGQIVYAAAPHHGLQRLRDFLCHHKLEAALDSGAMSAIATVSTPEYGRLCVLLKQGILSPKQGQSIVKGLIRETLFDLLSLHDGYFVFQTHSSLLPTLVTLETGLLTRHMAHQVQLWKQLYPRIQSPEQCPSIDNHATLQASLKPSSYETLTHWINGGVSIRQLSRYLNRDVVSVAKALYPYINEGIVHLPDVRTSHLWTMDTPSSTHCVPKIVCIDDGITFRQTIETMLRRRGYHIVTLGNPLEALGQVFRIKPDLILCDITMPELDGYELCAMLRKSTIFRQIPIVMLTGKDGFLDRMQARMVGASDYLTKPFSEEELIALVERYVGSLLSSVPRPSISEEWTSAGSA